MRLAGLENWVIVFSPWRHGSDSIWTRLCLTVPQADDLRVPKERSPVTSRAASFLFLAWALGVLVWYVLLYRDIFPSFLAVFRFV